MKLSDIRLYDLIPEEFIFMLHHLRVDIDGLREYSFVNEEDTPSCFIYYNTLSRSFCFKDFSSGEHGGPFKYLALKYKISTDEAKTLVHQTILNYLLGERKKPDILPKKATIEALPDLIRAYQDNKENKKYKYRGINLSSTKCEYNICAYDDMSYRYFSLYGLDKKDIEYYNIYTLCDVSIHSSRKKGDNDISEGLSYNQKLSNQKCIGYFNKAGDLMQIYIPREVAEWNGQTSVKSKKFFTLRPDLIPHIRSIRKHSVILAASIKDMICVHKCLRLLGLHTETAVATFYNERRQADEKHIELLKSLLPTRKEGYIYVLYDNDDTGIQHSKDLCQQLKSHFKNVENIYIDIHTHTDIGNNKESHPIKDFADICRYHGLKYACSWLYHHTLSPTYRYTISP